MYPPASHLDVLNGQDWETWELGAEVTFEGRPATVKQLFYTVPDDQPYAELDFGPDQTRLYLPLAVLGPAPPPTA